MTAAPTGTDAGRLPEEAAGRVIAELYAQHGRALYGVCRMLLRDAHEAEDATQSAFLSAYNALVRGGLPRDRTAWMFAIARNECRTRIRARMSSPITSSDDALVEVPGPETDPGQRLPDATLQQALQALPPRQREAIVLHDVYGLRSREVGRALGVSLPAVEALLFRARRQLRLRLQPVAGVLTLPVGLRDALAAAIPGFSDGSGAAGAAATGAAGLGLLAKLASAPSAAKVAAAAVAVGAAGSVAVGDSQPRRLGEQSTVTAVDRANATVRSAVSGKPSAASPAAPLPAQALARRSRLVAEDEDGRQSGRRKGEDASQEDDDAAPTGSERDHEDEDASDGATTASGVTNDGDDTDTGDDVARSGPGGGGTSSGDPDGGGGGNEGPTGPESDNSADDDPFEPEDESEGDDGDASSSGSGHDGGTSIDDGDSSGSGSGGASSRSGSSGSGSSGDDSPDEDEADDEDEND